MGSPFREARPKSPERLELSKIDSMEIVDGVPTITATFTYDTWCCSGFHEVMDAITTLNAVVEKASEQAYKRRMAGARKEHEELTREINGQG